MKDKLRYTKGRREKDNFIKNLKLRGYELSDLETDISISLALTKKYMGNKDFSLQNKRKYDNHIISKGFSYNDTLKAFDLAQEEREETN